MTDKTAKIEIFRVKLGEYYRVKEEDDRLDAMWGDDPENSELEKAADEGYEKAWNIGAECWKLFVAITKSDVKCGDFLIMLDRNPAKFRRMAITA